MASSVKIRPHMTHMRCVKFPSLDLGSAVYLRWLELSTHKTRGPGAMVLSHRTGVLIEPLHEAVTQQAAI